MAGIVSYGIYVPYYRLTRKAVLSAMSWFRSGGGPGEKAVANYDEDTITMAVAAARECMVDHDGCSKIDGLFFATTGAPYLERESAAIIATALDSDPEVRTSDFTDSLKSGTVALTLACESVQSRGLNDVIVCASDCRLAKPGSSQEMVFGDAAAAFRVGNDGVIATFEGSYGVSYDFPDNWRIPGDKFNRSSEDRWIRDEGYSKFIPQAIAGLLKKYGLQSKDISKVIFPGLFPREHAAIGKQLGFRPDQVQESLLNKIGDPGTASALVMLAVALDESKPGDNILCASYGSGSQALWFRVTDEIAEIRKSTRAYIESKKELSSYNQYLAFSGILPVDMGVRGEVGTTQLPLAWRDRKTILALNGSRCKRCGTPQYPPQRICVNSECGAIDEMEPYLFSDKKGTVFTYTEDYLAFSISPPQVYATIDFEGGGRGLFDITDCEPGALQVGTPVKMSLRRKYADQMRGINGYFWKAVPIRVT